MHLRILTVPGLFRATLPHTIDLREDRPLGKRGRKEEEEGEGRRKAETAGDPDPHRCSIGTPQDTHGGRKRREL